MILRSKLRDRAHARRATSGPPLIRIANVLCPVDLSEPSRRALDHAVAVTRWCEAKLVVLHVFSPLPSPNRCLSDTHLRA